jgi:hypothetical protein
MHFDIHPQVYREVMGDAGVTADSGYSYLMYKEIALSVHPPENKG